MNHLLAFGATEITLLIIALLIIAVVVIFLVIVPMKIYSLAIYSGYHIPASRLISMKKRNLDVKLIVDTYIASKRAGLDLTLTDYEAHYEASGSIERLLKALLLAKEANIKVNVEVLKALDKSGENVEKLVESVIIPQVLPFSNVIGMSQDKIELIVSGKISVKANLERFVGGIQEESLVARISSEIVNFINNSEYYNVILENPSEVSTYLKTKKLDKDSAFDIVSIDITNVRIGENYNLRVIRENAEKRKIDIGIETERLKQKAIIEEQMAKTRVQEEKIALIRQEKEFAQSLYDAVKNKDFGALDYFKIKNLQADTEMRTIIAHPEAKTSEDDDIKKLFDELDIDED